VVEAVRWDGSADTANGFVGEQYGVDWEYVPGKTDILIRGFGGYVKERVEVGQYLVKSGWVMYGMPADTFAEYWEPL
jgi:hypothetical protein